MTPAAPVGDQTEGLTPVDYGDVKVRETRQRYVAAAPVGDDGVRVMALTQGRHTILDAEDYERFRHRKWALNSNGYAVTNGPSVKGKRPSILLHRAILGVPKGICTDHINGDRLDNRRANLRMVTNAENTKNCGPRNGRKFKGVYATATRNKFAAMIKSDNKLVYLGEFGTELEAARAYNAAAARLHGAFARLNPTGDK